MRFFHRYLLTIAALALLPACGHMDITESTDRHPVVDHGVSATILMPGQQAPGMSMPPGHPAYTAQGAYGGHPAYGQAPAPGSPAQPGAPGAWTPPPAQPQTHYQSFGGASVQDTGQTRNKASPGAMRYLAAPIAIATAPFKKLYDKMKSDPAPVDPAQAAAAAAMQGGAAPSPPGAPVYPPTRQGMQAANENARLNELERQLAMVNSVPPPGVAPAAGTPTAAPPVQPGSSLSIAEELAALRSTRTGRPPQPGPTSAPFPIPAIPRATPDPKGVADHMEDRSGDGTPDYWAYREGDHLVREVSDDDGDGQPDKTVYYDDAGQVSRVEEDVDRDGQLDAWALYRGGDMVRRRADSDHDGAVDSWSFYRHGQIARTERDTDGDGFRDRLDVYEAGQLVREEEDRNADGRPDRVTWYDSAGQMHQRDDDSDGDGAIDVRSHYNGGRLARRELLSDEALAKLGTDGLPEVDDEAVSAPEAFQE